MVLRRWLRPLALITAAASLLLLDASAYAQTPSQYPISGNLSGISGSTTDLLQAKFALVNCGSGIPTVTGTTLPIKTSAIFTAGSSGVITGALWGNDAITCNGTASTLYQITYLRNNVPVSNPFYLRITASTDITTATPVTVVPPTTPLAAGVSCPNSQVLVGMTSDFQPVCQFVASGTAIYGVGTPSPSSCTLTAQATYYQTDATSGENQWACIGGIWIQQGTGSGIQLAGDIGGTTSVPQVIGVHAQSIDGIQRASTTSPTQTIQSAITNAGAAGAVMVRPDYSATDTYTNPNGVKLTDQRKQTEELTRLTVFMAPWLNKLGAGAGGNMTTLAKCIAAKSCVVSMFGNSILGGGGTAFENSVAVQFENAMEARYGHIFTWYNHTLGGRGVQNAVPYTTSAYPALPVCPTNTPACATAVASAPYAGYSYSAAYGYYFPATGNTNAKYGPPFYGADRKPWPNWASTAFQGWLYTGVLEAPDAVIFLYAMNDEAITGSVFTADVQAAIAPFLALSKVPSIILVAGPNGSVSTSGQAYFSQAKYANLDEFSEDLRGLAAQKGYGLIDSARVFSALRDGSDPASTFYAQDSSSFLNFSTNWEMYTGTSGQAAITGDGVSTVVQGAISSSGTWQALRTTVARDVLVAATWDTTNTNVVPAIQWRVPTDLSTTGYRAYLFNNGSGAGHVTVYSAGAGAIADVSVSGLTTSTSFMLQAEGNNYYVWVNGKLIIGPNYPTAGVGFDYDNIKAGYAGVGVTTLTVGTAYATTIGYVTLEPGSPLTSCATPLTNKQTAPPCAPAYVSDQALYGWAVDYGTNPRSMGGNEVNHPSIPGVYATYGVAMVPLLDHLDSTVAGLSYLGDTSVAKLNATNTWTAKQTLPAESGVVSASTTATESHWSTAVTGTGIASGTSCWISHKDSGAGSYAEADCVWSGGTGIGGFQRYISPGSHAVGSEVWTLVQQVDGTGNVSFPGSSTWGGGVSIPSSTAVPQVGTPVVNKAACIKSAGPPVVVGSCSTVVDSSGGCTCN